MDVEQLARRQWFSRSLQAMEELAWKASILPYTYFIPVKTVSSNVNVVSSCVKNGISIVQIGERFEVHRDNGTCFPIETCQGQRRQAAINLQDIGVGHMMTCFL
ncbi:hypothetical protein JTB14_010138 [Gonioctena quinquepunctata]|nr:hypothetical protein JTB14_010138 [Gonioctena quinquepunctata]